MAKPASRQELIDYCLRKLGEPVIEINVDPDQLEDCVDESIDYFNEYHSEGSQTRYYSHQITANDVDGLQIQLPTWVQQVVRVLPINNVGGTNIGMFNVQYQTMLESLNNGFMLSGDMAYYEQLQQHMSLLDMKLNGTPQISWKRYNNNLKIFGDLGNDLKEDDWIVVEVTSFVNPEKDSDHSNRFWNDMFLKEYTTALIKKQWGSNLIKFEGMQLPGGVTLNGRQIYDDAMQDIEKLQERLRDEFEAPIDFFVG